MTRPMKNENIDRISSIVENAIGLLSKGRSPGGPRSDVAPAPAPARPPVENGEAERSDLFEKIRHVEKFEYSAECAFTQSSEIGERFRELRTNLHTLSGIGSTRVFLFTSCHHQEGKTHTAINTARFLAQYEGKKTLLIDCDLRRPRVKEKIILDFKHGLEEVLAEKCTLEDALVFSEHDNLTVLPTLSGRSNATELLESARMENLLSRVRGAFDYVFIDSSPVLSTADPLVIGAKVDGVILTVKSGATQRDSVEHAIGLLRQANANIVGIVLTQMKNYIPRYLYKYHYFCDVYSDYYKADPSGNFRAKTKRRRHSSRRP